MGGESKIVGPTNLTLLGCLNLNFLRTGLEYGIRSTCNNLRQPQRSHIHASACFVSNHSVHTVVVLLVHCIGNEWVYLGAFCAHGGRAASALGLFKRSAAAGSAEIGACTVGLGGSWRGFVLACAQPCVCRKSKGLQG